MAERNEISLISLSKESRIRTTNLLKKKWSRLLEVWELLIKKYIRSLADG